MSKRLVILSLGYWFSAYALGLILHPYKTVRELVRNPEFEALVWTPVVYWVIGWGAGMVGLRFGWVFLLIFGIDNSPEWLVLVLAFLWWWLTLFLVLWQVLLGYLWFRLRDISAD